MAEVDASQLKATPPGPEGGKTGEKTSILIAGGSLKALADGLSFIVDGRAEPLPEIMCNNALVNGAFEAYFVALEPGEYMVDICFHEKPIQGTPFTIKVTGKKVPASQFLSEVKVSGDACKSAKINEVNKFTVDCKSVKPLIGGLKAHCKAPQRCGYVDVDIQDNKNGTYTLIYEPTSPGQHVMDITIAEEHIPGSPLKIMVA